VEISFVEGNEEFLNIIYPIVELSFGDEADHLKKELAEKALWGSMGIVIGSTADGEVHAVGVATVNNQNTGHVDYIIIKDSPNKEHIEKEVFDKLTKWVKWLRVKSISVEPRYGNF